MTSQFESGEIDSAWREATRRRFGGGIAEAELPCAVFLLGCSDAIVGALHDEIVSWFAKEGGCVLVAPREYSCLHPQRDRTESTDEVSREVESVAAELIENSAENRQHVLLLPEIWSAELGAWSARTLLEAGHRTIGIVIKPTATDENGADSVDFEVFRQQLASMQTAADESLFEELYLLDEVGNQIGSYQAGQEDGLDDSFFGAIVTSLDRAVASDSQSDEKPDERADKQLGRSGRRKIKMANFSAPAIALPTASEPPPDSTADQESSRKTDSKKTRGIKLGEFNQPSAKSDSTATPAPVEVPLSTPIVAQEPAARETNAELPAHENVTAENNQQEAPNEQPSSTPPPPANAPASEVERRRQLQARIRQFADGAD